MYLTNRLSANAESAFTRSTVIMVLIRIGSGDNSVISSNFDLATHLD
jgi:hypothetical protein